jgi:L-seryl-tRNA(Ser) seleniumtransferase
MPGVPIPSVAIAVTAPDLPAETLAARLRAGHPPVVGRIADGLLLLDMLTVDDSDIETLAALVRACLPR